MDTQKLYSLTRQAIEDYNLIDEGDKIAVGVSGGKDSLTLLIALSGLRKFYPKKFELMAITCDVGFGMDFSPVEELCEKLNVPYEIVHTQIKDIVFEGHAGERPCSLCAKMRKGAMNNRLKELGFNKMAYAHNKDDYIETSIMSLLYEGRFYAFPPKTLLDVSELTVIRPLMYVPEKSIRTYAERENLPVIKNKCPVDGSTKRAYAKEVIEMLGKDNKEVKERIMHAILNANLSDWPKKSDACE